MGPSTFSAYCDALILGFSSLEVDQRAKNFQKYVDQFKSLIVKNLDEVVKHNNKVIAAVGISGPIERLGRQPGRLHAAAVVATAAKLSEFLAKK